MGVQQYSLVSHDWVVLEGIINDLARSVGQELSVVSEPTFAGLTLTGLTTDVVKATNGILSDVGSPTKDYTILWNGSAPVWAVQGTSFIFTIASFTYSGYTSIIEMGVADSEWAAIGALSFTATYNNGPPDATPYISKTSPEWSSNLDMTGAGYVGPTTNAEAVNYPSAINGNRQFVLYAEVGAENDTETKTVYFRNKKYFGFSSTTGQLDSAETIALSETAFVAASSNDLDTSATNLSPTGSQYIHFAYPSRLDPSDIKFYLGGFETDFTDNGTFTFTNASGFAETYRDYESPHAYDATTELVVSATP